MLTKFLQVIIVLVPVYSSIGVGPAWGQNRHRPDDRLEGEEHNNPHRPLPRESTGLRFTADGQYVLVSEGDAINLISGNLTIEAWVKPEAAILLRGYSSIVSKQLNGTGYMLATNNIGEHPGFKAEVGGIQVTSGAQTAVNGWQHVAAVWTEGELRIYVNGQFDGIIPTGPPIPNMYPLWIGSSPFGSDTNWRGSIDEVRVWSVARTAEQIRSTMNRSLCKERGLRASWSFDEGEGSVITDALGRSDGVVAGPEWVAGVTLERNDECQTKGANGSH